jgi:hypothetical protein
MNIRKPFLFLLFLTALSAAAPADEPLACNLHALTSAERERHQALSAKLKEALVRSQERAKGYAFTLDPAHVTLLQLAEWVSLEARCCPFLDFGIRFQSKGAELTLELTGESPEVKSFLQHEIAAVR